MLLTLSEARSRVRELADLESYDDEIPQGVSTNDPRFLHSRKLDRAINRWLKRLWNKYQLAFGEDWTTRDHSFTVSNGTSDYLLPDGWMRIIAVQVQDSSDSRTYDIGHYEPRDEAALRSWSTSGWAHPSDWLYRVVDTLPTGEVTHKKRLRLLPVPGVDGYTCLVRYTPAFAELVDDADTFDGVNGWEDWALYGAAAEMAALDTAGSPLEASLTRSRLELGAEIDQLVAQRDAADPAEIQDVRGDHHSGHDLRSRTTLTGGMV